MKKKTVAVGDKVFVIAENGETVDISMDANAPLENFKKALSPRWPEQ